MINQCNSLFEITYQRVAYTRLTKSHPVNVFTKSVLRLFEDLKTTFKFRQRYLRRIERQTTMTSATPSVKG